MVNLVGTPGNLEECTNIIRRVFEELDDNQCCHMSVDEIHIKPRVSYRGNRLIGHAVETERSSSVKTVLVMVIIHLLVHLSSW